MPPPPPVTPSPYRFRPSQQRAHSPQKDTRPGSTLRKPKAQSIYVSPELTQEQSRAPSQFNQTPRFSFGKSKASPLAAGSPSPKKSAFTEVLRASGRPGEDVEDAAEQGDEDEMLLDEEQALALPTTELNRVDDRESYNQWMNDLAFSPKRRKLDDQEGISGVPIFKLPQTPASHLSKSASQIIHSESQSTTSTQSPNHQRPAFLRSSVAPQEQSEPPPETFSPHKRGQKFGPGGMAATLQQWIIETGQAAVHSRKGQGYLRGEDYVMRVKIDRFTGHGPYTAYGRAANGDDVRVFLAGAGKADTPLSIGNIIGIRAPTWEVELDEMRWSVGVDWKIIS